MHTEKEQLIRQQMSILRDQLKNLERDCELLRKQLDNERKVQAQKNHKKLHEVG